MTRQPEPQPLDPLYQSYGKDLYRTTGTEATDDIMQMMLADPTANNSQNVTVSASDLGSGVDTSTTISATGSYQGGKKTFDNTDTGFILGVDPTNGKAKFYIGNTANYMNWDGTTLTVNGNFVIGQLSITIGTTGDIQGSLNTLSAQGGGILYLEAGTYTVSSTITVPSDVSIVGVSQSGTVLDFGGTAAQFLIQGSSAYATGTISVNYGSASVTGAGTSWNSSMVGQSILLGDYWYTIAAVGGAGALTLSTVFIGTNLAADTYVIATTVSGVTLQNLTLTNSSGTALRFRYVNGMNLNTIGITSANQAIDGDDSANINLQDGYFIDSCVIGITYDNVPFCVFKSGLISNITGGTALALTRVTNTALDSLSVQAVTGVGAKLTNCANFGFTAFSIIKCTSHGLELVSGNNDIDIISGYVNTCGGDGIKFTATSDRSTIVACSLLNNTGYGVNIAASTCDDNKIIAPAFSGNVSGTVNDSGTGTFISPQTLSGADVQTFSANGTWNKPVTGNLARIQVWGGGGGGQFLNSGVGASGGGGGGYNERTIILTSLGSTETVTVPAAAAVGATGGTCSFGTWISAFGGGPGSNAGGGSGSGGGGGGGATGAGLQGVTTVGGTGGAPGGSLFGTGNSGAGGAGGSSASGTQSVQGYFGGGGGASSGAGGAIGGNSFMGGAGGGGGNNSTGGAGGTSVGGGNGGAGGVNGSAGTAPGGGGGGGGSSAGTGAAGRVVVTVF